jgi:type VI secretion system secreted protein Hcp
MAGGGGTAAGPVIFSGILVFTGNILRRRAITRPYGGHQQVSNRAFHPCRLGPASTSEVTMAAFIKFEGIDGETKDKNHQNWSDVFSISQNIRNQGVSSLGKGRGDTIFEPIAIDKLLDKASPKIAEALANGKVISKVQIHITGNIVDEARSTYLAYELRNVRIGGYSLGGIFSVGTGQEDHPRETILLQPEEIKMTYTEAENGKKKGTVEFGWSITQGSKL